MSQPLLAGHRRCPRVSTCAHRSLFCKVFCPFFFSNRTTKVFIKVSASLSSRSLATVEAGASVISSLSVSTGHFRPLSILACEPLRRRVLPSPHLVVCCLRYSFHVFQFVDQCLGVCKRTLCYTKCCGLCLCYPSYQRVGKSLGNSTSAFSPNKTSVCPNVLTSISARQSAIISTYTRACLLASVLF